MTLMTTMLILMLLYGTPVTYNYSQCGEINCQDEIDLEDYDIKHRLLP